VIQFDLTPRMLSMLETHAPYAADLSVVFSRWPSQIGDNITIEISREDALKLLNFYVRIVNGVSAYLNNDPSHTSALAAIKRIRKALGLAQADFAKNPNLRGR